MRASVKHSSRWGASVLCAAGVRRPKTACSPQARDALPTNGRIFQRNLARRNRMKAKGQVGKVRGKNPKGISSGSPGLRGTSYPGLTTGEIKTPTGFHQPGEAEGRNPVGV